MAEQLPIVGWRRFSHITGWHFWGDEEAAPGASTAEALTPHAPAQSALDELRREVEALRAIIRDADRMLTNLQPHIPQACLPGREGFIDNYIDPTLEKLRSVLPEWRAAIDAARASTDDGVGK